MHMTPGEMIVGFFRGRLLGRQRFVEGFVEGLGHNTRAFLECRRVRDHGMTEAFHQRRDQFAVGPRDHAHAKHAQPGRNEGHGDNATLLAETLGRAAHQIDVGHDFGTAQIEGTPIHLLAPDAVAEQSDDVPEPDRLGHRARPVRTEQDR